MKRLLPLVLGALLLLLVFGLRLHRLGEQSLWNDEGSSWVQALRPLPEIAANAARDIHPPGYYVLLAGWRLLAGESEYALRLLSAFASLLAGALLLALARRTVGLLAAVFAGLFYALNTFSLYYAQEARMYALLALWSVLLAWLLARLMAYRVASAEYPVGMRKGASVSGAPAVLAVALATAGGLYTHYAFPFVMLALGVGFGLWWLRRPRLRAAALGRYALANGLALLLFAPWLPTALRQVTGWPSTGAPIPAGEALATITGWLALGVTTESAPGAISFLPLGLALLAVGLLLHAQRAQGGSQGLRAALLWAVLPVLLFLALGLFRPANLKFLLPSQIALALLMGAGLAGWWALARGSRPTVVLALLLTLAWGYYALLALPPLYDDPRYRRPDYRAMAARIQAAPTPGDAIILNAPNQAEVFGYYYRGAAPVYPLPVGLGGDDAAAEAAARAVIRDHRRLFVLFWGEAERDPNRIVERTLDAEAYEAGQDTWYGDVRFARYQTPEPLTITRTLGAPFGPTIRLERFALNRASFQPGDVLQLQLDWRTTAALERRYKVFVQLLTSDGILVAQRDSEPVGGSRPTLGWPPGEIIRDRHGLALPDDLPPGRYGLIVGLYDADDPAARLPTRGGQDYGLLGVVEVGG